MTRANNVAVSVPTAEEAAARLGECFHANSEGVAAACLFGSQALGIARNDSDVHVAVSFERAAGTRRPDPSA